MLFMIDTTDFLGVSMPPFLSRIVLSGQLKSPPKMIFSSSSKFSFFNVANKSAKIRFSRDNPTRNSPNYITPM